MKNTIGREIPDEILERYHYKPYAGPFAITPTGRLRGGENHR